jgi:hypothetical protein
MYSLLMLAGGFFWSLAYILIIQRSFQDKTYGMPLAALCLNISWEFIFSFVFPHQLFQRTINIVWFCLDAVILLQLLRYGDREFPQLPKSAFYAVVVFALATCFCSVFFVSIEANDYGGVYAAFGQNLLMSILFITMLFQRQSLRGQSVWIAICKWIGTASNAIAFYLYADISKGSVLLPFFYISIFVYDLIYVGLIVKHQQRYSQLNFREEM